MWKDISSFSRDAKDRTPRTFEFKVGKIRIIVTRHIFYDADDWLLVCEPFTTGHVISTGTAKEAKQAALDFIENQLEDALEELRVKNV